MLHKTHKMQQEQIVKKCKDLYNRIDKNTISLVFAQNKGDIDKISECNEIEKSLIMTALKCDVAEYFKMFFIAEYKEKIYESMFDPFFRKMELDILCEIERIVQSMYTYKDIYNYIFDHENFLFKGRFYSFYEFVECKGANIMDQYNI